MRKGPTPGLDPPDPTAGSPTAGAGTPRRRDVQGLRAVAVVLVVLFHSGLRVPGGFVGVDIFFVISGFVVTAMLLRELNTTDRLDLRVFYARRARRLLPALATMIVVVAVVSALLLSPVSSSQVRTATTGGATSVFASNAELYLVTESYFDNPTNALIHTWTLAVEEQFYVFFAPLVLLGWWFGRRRRTRWPSWSPRATVAGTLVIVAGGSLVLSLWLTGVNPRLAFYASPARAWEFAAGAVLALAVPALGRVGRRTASVLGVLGIGLIAVAAWRITPGTPFPGTAAMLPVAGAVLVIAAGTASTTRVSAALATGPAVWIGDLSYGWYLWHWPVIVFARALWPAATWALPLAGVASLGPAWLSYRIVEQPIRAQRAIVGRRVLALTAACVILPLASCAGLRFGARAVRSSDGAIGDLVHQYGLLHYDFAHHCSSLGSDVEDATCSWHPAGPSRGRVVLVGDSNAGQFTEPILSAATELHLDFAVATRAGCPFVDVEIHTPTRDFTPCRAYLADALAEILRDPPDLVVSAAASPEYIERDDVSLRDPSGGGFVLDRQAKAAIWERGLESVLGRLDRAGVPTVVVHPIPYLVPWDLGLCPAYRLYTDVRDCGIARSRSSIDGYRQRAFTAETTAMAGLAHVRGLDLTDDLCAPVCRTNLGRLWIYRDKAHLSVGGSLTLTGRFTELLRPAAA